MCYAIFTIMATFPRIGLALGSGGAKGLAHIGVLKILEKHNIPIHAIAGSSIGSLIGAHYAAFGDTKRIEELVYQLDRKVGIGLVDISLRGGLLKGNKIEMFIHTLLDGATFEKLRIPYAAVATDFMTAESIVMKEGNLTKAIRASISIPTFFQPVEYNGRLLADGGLSNPVPVDILRSMNVDIVIAVNLDMVYKNEVIEKVPSLSGIPLHSVNILRHHLALQSSKTADVIITPQTAYKIDILGWNYCFDTEKAKTIIRSGEDATEALFPQITEVITEWNRRKRMVSRVHRFFDLFRKKKA